MQNFDHLKLGYCTLSAGSKPEDTLPVKLQAIAAAGFTGIELGFPDLVGYAKSELGSSFKGEADWDALEQVAKTVRTKCEELGLVSDAPNPLSALPGFALTVHFAVCCYYRSFWCLRWIWHRAEAQRQHGAC